MIVEELFMTKLMLIEKAKKIAARMQSPFENEAIIAATMLRKLLDEHGLSLQDIGVKEYYSRKATSSPNVLSSPVYTSQNVGFTRVEEIVEVHYRHGVSSLTKWQIEFSHKLALLYNVQILFDLEYSKIIGFPEDVEVFKSILVSMKSFLESQLASRRYSFESDIFGYINGFFSRLEEGIYNEITPAAAQLASVKKDKIAEYVKRYDIKRKSSAPDRYSDTAYAAGRADADPRPAIERR